MKTIRSILFIVCATGIAACTSHKKNSKVVTSPVATVSPGPTAPVASTNALPLIKPSNGIYPPGNEELTAIQATYKDVTLAKLQEGHTIYTQSACIQCHEPMNIYKYNETTWKSIIGDMAQRARITDAQRDAVYKYVLAIKATQPK